MYIPQKNEWQRQKDNGSIFCLFQLHNEDDVTK
jgi:hypothetical protein